MTDLGTLGGWHASASAVNDSGQIVGSSQIPGTEDSHAFLWENGTMRDLGENYLLANDINNHSQIVGLANNYYAFHAFLWENGTTKDLGTLGGSVSQAFAINESAQVATLTES